MSTTPTPALDEGARRLIAALPTPAQWAAFAPVEQAELLARLPARCVALQAHILRPAAPRAQLAAWVRGGLLAPPAAFLAQAELTREGL